MEKGDVEKYLIIVLVFAGLAAIVLVLRPSPTGYAVYLGQYENQTACEDAGNVWYDGGCYDELPVCDSAFLELCLDETNCTGAGGYWYNDVCNAEEEPSCSNDLTLCLDDVNCTGVGGYWYDVNGTLICNAEEEPSCSNDLTLCLDEINCTGVAEGYWYNDDCNADCSGDLSTCRDESGCNSVNSYWYDDNADGTSTCNANECDDDDDCDSGLVCTTDNVCCEPQTCSDLGKECGTGWDDSCGGTVDCDNDCADDENCDDDGTCVGDSSDDDSSSSSSSETTEQRDENKNLELSGQDKVLVSAGSSEEAELHVVNVGKYQLSCSIEGDWISSEEKIEQLNKEGEVDIKYIVSVPAGTDAGDYSKELIVKCTGAISESKIIDITVVAGEGSITGEVIGEEAESGAGITGGVIGAGSGRVIAYIVFLLVLVCAVVLVWRRHAQIRGLDGLLFRGKEWFNTKFHKGK